MEVKADFGDWIERDSHYNWEDDRIIQSTIFGLEDSLNVSAEAHDELEDALSGSEDAPSELKDTLDRVHSEQVILEAHTQPDSTLDVIGDANGYGAESTTTNDSAPDIQMIAKVGSADNTTMYVQPREQPEKLCCIYCLKHVLLLERHLHRMHKEEAEVKKLALFTKGSKERRDTFEAIKKKGEQNLTVWRNIIIGTDAVSADLSSVAERLHPEPSDFLRKFILPSMCHDEIVRLITNDRLAIIYGNFMCMKYTPHYQHKMIRYRLRLVGRWLFELKKITHDVTDLDSSYHPKNYDSVMESIRIVGKLDTITNRFGAPATAAKIVTQIKQIGRILIADGIKREDKEVQNRTKNFLYLMSSDAATIINKLVYESQSEKKRKKVEVLPSTDDINTLAQFLDDARKKYVKSLNEEFSEKTWMKLSEVTVASIIVFNRRRTGEVQNTEVSSFYERQTVTEATGGELFMALSSGGKEKVQKYSIMKVRGKQGRTVSVLLTTDMVESIELILKHRDAAGVASNNKCLFALRQRTASKTYVVNACEVIKKFANECGALVPETLRGTMLRKHLATYCASKELNDNSVADVADFMGHHDKVHREYYRKNTLERQVVQISLLLECASGDVDDAGAVSGTVNDNKSKVSDDQLESNKTSLKRKMEPEVQLGTDQINLKSFRSD